MPEQRRKLLILLGAGSSVDVGMPLVSELDRLMRSWAAEYGVYDEERWQPNFYDYAWRSVEEHLAAWPANRERWANFELALGTMAGLANWVKPSPHGQALRNLVGANENLPQFFAENRMNKMHNDDSGPFVAVRNQYVDLLIRLANDIRARCCQISAGHSTKLDEYTNILQRLRERFDVGIYSLNYDDTALQAWPDAYVGFSEQVDTDGCRAFDPREVHARREWGFIYHLHGSVHFTLPNRLHSRGVFNDHIRWRNSLNGTFVDGTPHGASILDERSDGTEIPVTTLIAGGFKLDQLLGDPFQSTYAALVRHVHEADAFLIAGYGFGDAHVNRAFLSRMTRGDKAPPVMILERTRDDRETMSTRIDGWPHRLLSALALGGGSFVPIPGTVEGVKRRRSFETAGGRVAVWHNGFLEASERLDAIIDWLHGDLKAIGPTR